jgi:hypothetical protein
MSKIKINQIDDNNITVSFPSETPITMVSELCKTLISKGLVEDLNNSTLVDRHFYRPQDRLNNIADQLIKSLSDISGLSKASDQIKAQWAQQAQSRLADRNARRQASGLSPMTVEQMKNPAAAKPTPAATPAAAPAPAPGASTLPGVPNKVHDPSLSGTVNYAKKSDEHQEGDDSCTCEKCSIAKSNYGPKGAKQYNPADNARRKMGNTGDIAGQGPNVNVKSYSTKPGQVSAKASANLTARIQQQANKKQPIKQFSPEEIAAENAKRGLKKSWGQHGIFPNAEEEMVKQSTPQTAEDLMAQQLVNLMNGKAMLGQSPLAQPTDDQMFGHLVVTEDMVKAKEKEWQGAAFNWLTEAAKPIAQKFSSEEEELAYWDSIKVNDRDDGKSGY